MEHIEDVITGAHDFGRRAKWLQEVNKRLQLHGIRLTEDCSVTHPVQGMGDVTHQDITLRVWVRRKLMGWRQVAIIVPGEEFPRVKDGQLPEALSIKKIVTEGDELPPYFQGYRLAYLLLEGEPIMVIRGCRIHHMLLGHGVEYDAFQLHYAPVRPV